MAYCLLSNVVINTTAIKISYIFLLNAVLYLLSLEFTLGRKGIKEQVIKRLIAKKERNEVDTK